MNLDRRAFLGAVGAGLTLSLLPKGQAARARRIRYVDGLSVTTSQGGWEDLPSTGMSAAILDVSDGEVETLPDGSMAFRRTYHPCLKSLARARRTLREQVKGAFVALKGSEIPASPDGRIAAFFQFQGADFVEKDLERITVFHELGLRVLQFTHHFGNTLAGGCMDTTPTGLTPLGRKALEHLESLSILPDLAHASDLTALDVIKAARRPVIISHGACRAIVRNIRNTPDEVIRGVAERGGVMGVFMMSFWLTEDDVPTVDHVVAQLRHIIRVGGINAAGIANDYAPGGEPSLRKLGNDNARGVRNYLPWWLEMRKRGMLGFDRIPKHVVIPALNQPRRLFLLHAALERGGFKSTEIEKLMGGNWIRVLTDGLG